MGRKTWFSIPEKCQPLKDRINVVLSRELKEPPHGVHYLASSLDDALNLLELPELADKEVMNKPGHQQLFIIRILQEFESDTFFPEIDLKKYKLQEYSTVSMLMSKKKKAFSINLKYMKNMTNMKDLKIRTFDGSPSLFSAVF
uniref:dihydrofolate reductase n=1 Tax=Monodelphis domestica TaxID=13616 RepID=A0A5F8HIZ3_MONDO